MFRLAPLLWLGYIAMGIVQFMATYAFFRGHWDWGFLMAGLASFFLAYFPLVGSICGMIGAMYVWHWAWWQAGLLFSWWPVLYVSMVGGFSLLAIFSRFQGTSATKDPFILHLRDFSEKIELDTEDLAPLLQAAKKNKKDIDSPHEAAFWLLMNFLVPELTHGYNHVYRGVLSMRGNYLFGCFNRLVLLGTKQKIITAEQANNVRENVQDEIKEVG